MITVKYFASLRPMAGKEEDQFNLGSETTLERLSEEISKTAPKIGEMMRGKKVMISVNHEVVVPGAVIRDGDEVALLPPFSGGC
jgi:molybdopterin converting factor subunit 1